MKHNVIQQHLEDLVKNLVIPENDAFKIHPSITKKHQPMEIFEAKVYTVLHNLKIPPKVLSETYKYYLSNDELADYTTLSVGSMFLTGPVHSGKTLFLLSKYIIASIISVSYPLNTCKVVYVEYSELIQKFKQAINDKDISESSVYDTYKTAKVLLIDDLFSGGMVTEYAMNILYTIVDYRHSSFLPTLITTNLTEAEIAVSDNGKRLLRRLQEHAGSIVFTTKD